MQQFNYECKYITLLPISRLVYFDSSQDACVERLFTAERMTASENESKKTVERDALKVGRKIINSPVSYKLLSILLNTFLIAFLLSRCLCWLVHENSNRRFTKIAQYK